MAKAKKVEKVADTKSDEPKVCMVPNCSREANIRGLCKSCYATAARLVKQEQTTWEELEQKGRIAPSRRANGGLAAEYLMG